MTEPGFSQIAHYRTQLGRLKTIRVKHDLIGRQGEIALILQRHLLSIARERHLRVLDIGAYDKAFGRALARHNPDFTYHSVDVDSSNEHEYHDIRDVNGTYDAICMFELIEHLALPEAIELLRRAYSLLNPGGRMFISTPNPDHPTRYFSDVTHKQPWPAGDLYAVLRGLGFSRTHVEMYGVIYTPPNLSRLLLMELRHIMWHFIGIERRGGILAIATKG